MSKVGVEQPQQQLTDKQILMNHIQIQQEELDVLQAIYLDDIRIIRSSAPYKFEIIVKPFLENFDEVSYAQYNLRIIIEFVKSYPDKAPLLELQPITNITQDQVAQIELLSDQILENINGEPILYGLVEQVRSWIYENIIHASLFPEVQEDTSLANKKKFDTYTPVTLESFAIWKQKFADEMQQKKLDAQKSMQHIIDEQQKKITGEQFFLNLVAQQDGVKEEAKDGEDDDEDDDDDDDDVYDPEDDQYDDQDQDENDLDWGVE